MTNIILMVGYGEKKHHYSQYKAFFFPNALAIETVCYKAVHQNIQVENN